MHNKALYLVSTPSLEARHVPTQPLLRTQTATGPGLADFERLGLSVEGVGTEWVQLTGCFAHRLDLRVTGRPREDDDDSALFVWDVLAHWRLPRRLCLVPSDVDEWLGMCSLDAFALLRGLRNDAIAETTGLATVSDCFEHCGRRVVNPFRDRFGNDTCPASEYGHAYRLWRSRWCEASGNIRINS